MRQFKGGQSNPTYLLLTPQKNYVLRRKPPGQLLASAHAVDREFRVISALGEHTDVPVPRAHLLCTDDAVIGTWFYVMDHVEGRIFWDPSFPDVPVPERRAHSFALCDALAKLHRVRPEAAGLGDYGKSTGYLARQIARFSKQYQEDTAGGRVESMERLIEWLPRNMPQHEPPAAVVHGDYRADNVIFHPTEPRVVAILDWELSSLGDPLADFAYHLMAYRLPTLSIPMLAGRDLEALGLPSEAEYVAHYEQVTGGTDRSARPRVLPRVRDVPAGRHLPRHPQPGGPRHGRQRPGAALRRLHRHDLRRRLGPGPPGGRSITLHRNNHLGVYSRVC